MRITYVVPCVLVVTAACLYRTDMIRFEQTVRPETSPDSIRVLGQEPKQPFEVVAMVSVTPSYLLTGGYDRVTWKLAQEAAKLGGHAVLIEPASLSQSKQTSTMSAKVLVFDNMVVPADAAFARRHGTTAAVVVTLGIAAASIVPLFFLDWNEP